MFCVEYTLQVIKIIDLKLHRPHSKIKWTKMIITQTNTLTTGDIVTFKCTDEHWIHYPDTKNRNEYYLDFKINKSNNSWCNVSPLETNKVGKNLILYPEKSYDLRLIHGAYRARYCKNSKYGPCVEPGYFKPCPCTHIVLELKLPSKEEIVKVLTEYLQMLPLALHRIIIGYMSK